MYCCFHWFHIIYTMYIAIKFVSAIKTVKKWKKTKQKLKYKLMKSHVLKQVLTTSLPKKSHYCDFHHKWFHKNMLLWEVWMIKIPYPWYILLSHIMIFLKHTIYRNPIAMVKKAEFLPYGQNLYFIHKYCFLKKLIAVIKFWLKVNLLRLINSLPIFRFVSRLKIICYFCDVKTHCLKTVTQKKKKKKK